MRGRNAFFAANADEKACFGAHEARSEKREARSEKRIRRESGKAKRAEALSVCVRCLHSLFTLTV
ncbi:hypothetical protein A1OW_08975 [Enterovibrio norvegicus]|nr:hypothetical protein A1OW_08975 [Enterovibrio norvegicus]